MHLGTVNKAACSHFFDATFKKLFLRVSLHHILFYFNALVCFGVRRHKELLTRGISVTSSTPPLFSSVHSFPYTVPCIV